MLLRPDGTGPVDILLVEDSDGDARLFREMLREEDFRVLHVKRLADAQDALRRQRFQVILLDLGLPDSEGIETLRRACSNKVDAPVIVVLTGNNDQHLAIDAVREGAQDYLVKAELDVNVLIRAIRYAVERHNLQQALEQARRDAESARQRDFYAALTEVADLANEHPNPTDGRLAELERLYVDLSARFINSGADGDLSGFREHVREFTLHAAASRVRARHIVSMHLRTLAAVEQQLGGHPLEQTTSELRLLLVEVLGRMMDTYLSVYRVMQPSEHET